MNHHQRIFEKPVIIRKHVSCFHRFGCMLFQHRSIHVLYLCTVFFDRCRQARTSSRSFLIRTTSAACTVNQVLDVKYLHTCTPTCRSHQNTSELHQLSFYTDINTLPSYVPQVNSTPLQLVPFFISTVISSASQLYTVATSSVFCYQQSSVPLVNSAPTSIPLSSQQQYVFFVIDICSKIVQLRKSTATSVRCVFFSQQHTGNQFHF